ncbi:hypothetical protein [Pleomorphomonas koreensis]|uniref:hypothetical protein n=1 Tax=Pleomorphomonas koreensis TaxID=257440 RepID=UPI0012EB31BA|nr:hypothetical protein [Pleomorphomonas koreensis]
MSPLFSGRRGSAVEKAACRVEWPFVRPVPEMTNADVLKGTPAAEAFAAET